MKKDYFNLDDVAKQLKCVVGDLLHYAAQGRLNLSVLLAGEKATLHIWDSNPNKSEYAEDITEADEFMMGARIVEELFGPFPLPLSSAKILEAGRLHEINGVSDRLPKEEFSEWRLLNPLKATNIKIVVEAEDLKKFKDIYDLTNEAPVTREWKRLARELGVEWMKSEEKKTGKRPTIDSIAKYLADEFSNRKITGARGTVLDWASIKKVLTGITEKKRGDNLKIRMRKPHLR